MSLAAETYAHCQHNMYHTSTQQDRAMCIGKLPMSKTEVVENRSGRQLMANAGLKIWPHCTGLKKNTVLQYVTSMLITKPVQSGITILHEHFQVK